MPAVEATTNPVGVTTNTLLTLLTPNDILALAVGTITLLEPFDIRMTLALILVKPAPLPVNNPPKTLPDVLINPLDKMLPAYTLPLAVTTVPTKLEPYTIPAVLTEVVAVILLPAIIPEDILPLIILPPTDSLLPILTLLEMLELLAVILLVTVRLPSNPLAALTCPVMLITLPTSELIVATLLTFNPTGTVTPVELTVIAVIPAAATVTTLVLETLTKLVALDILEIPVNAAPLPTKVEAYTLP